MQTPMIVNRNVPQTRTLQVAKLRDVFQVNLSTSQLDRMGPQKVQVSKNLINQRRSHQGFPSYCRGFPDRMLKNAWYPRIRIVCKACISGSQEAPLWTSCGSKGASKQRKNSSPCNLHHGIPVPAFNASLSTWAMMIGIVTYSTFLPHLYTCRNRRWSRSCPLSSAQRTLKTFGHEIQSLWAKGMWEEHHLSQWSLNVSPGRQQTQWSHHSPWISRSHELQLPHVPHRYSHLHQPACLSLQQKWINPLFTVTGYCCRLGLIRHLFTKPEINHSRVDGM